jgi:hypothetical protein
MEMEFAYPAAFAGLAAIPLLFLLNLWKYRRLRVRVSSMVIWKRMSERIEAPSASRQRYFNLSLLMQIVFVLALTTAIAGPRIEDIGVAGRAVHILIDLSASTQADSAGSRVFDRITLGAAGLLRILAESDSVYCHYYPGLAGLETLGPFRPAEALERLSQLKPTELSGEISEAALQVAAVGARDAGQTFVFTDHLLHDLPDDIRVAVVPADPGNTAITAAKSASDSRDMHVFFRIANYSSSEKSVEWALAGASGRRYTPAGSSPIRLRPGASSGVAFPLPAEAFEESLLEIRILQSDALASDNSAYIFRNPMAALRISYIGSEIQDLVRVLSALPGATVTLSGEPEPGCMLAVFNEVSPSELPACTSVVIAPPEGIPGLVADPSGRRYKPALPFVTKDSTLFTNPDWAQKLTVAEALQSALLRETGTVRVLESDGVPLVADFSLEGRRVIYIGFRLSDSNWSSQLSFPLFWGLLAEQACASTEQWSVCRTGGTVALPARGLAGVTSPSGQPLAQALTSPRVILRPESVGIYRAAYPDGDKLFGVSLLDSRESDLSRVDIPFDPSWLAPPGRTESRTTNWLWQYFAFIAALAMLAAWTLSRERKRD